MGGTALDGQTLFGPYRVLRPLGSGGMGSVFEAEDTSLGHRVALKLLHPHVAQRKGAPERFVREGRAAARVRHPHIVQVLALGIEGETPYLAMELLEGDDLSQQIAREGRLSIEDTLDIVLPVVAAVAAAHDAGVIHRDLKPSNVCITRGPGGHPWPKVVDFGVSKVITADAAHAVSVTDAVVGTAAYMAPEQARASNGASFRSDQYSLAVLVYQCVTGTLPFSGRGVYEIVEAIMTAPLIPPSARVAGVPCPLDAAVLRAMSRDPGDRYPSVRAFGEALLPLASERTRLALAAELRLHVEADGLTTESALATDLRPTPAETTLPRTESHTLAVKAVRAGGRVAIATGVLALIAFLAVLAWHHAGPGPAAPAVAALPPTATGPIPSVAIAEPTASNAPIPPAPVAPTAGGPSPVRATEVPSPHAAGSGPAASPRAHLGPRTPAPGATTTPIVLGDNGAPILP